MHIVHQTPSRLEIAIPQRLVKVIALVFVVVGGGWFAMLTLPYQLQCEVKQAGIAKQCYASHALSRLVLGSQSLGDITKAKVLVRAKKSTGSNYLVRLYTSKGKTLLATSVSPSETRVRNAVRAINKFIVNGEQQTFSVPNFYPIYLQLFLFIFPAAGLVLYLFVGTTRIIFDKVQEQLCVETRRLFFSAKRCYPLNAIEKIDLEESYSQKHGTTYQVICIFQDGTCFALNSVSDGLVNSKREVVIAINQFLGKQPPSSLDVQPTLAKQQRLLGFIIFIVGLTVMAICLILGYLQ